MNTEQYAEETITVAESTTRTKRAAKSEDITGYYGDIPSVKTKKDKDDAYAHDRRLLTNSKDTAESKGVTGKRALAAVAGKYEDTKISDARTQSGSSRSPSNKSGKGSIERLRGIGFMEGAPSNKKGKNSK